MTDDEDVIDDTMAPAADGELQPYSHVEPDGTLTDVDLWEMVLERDDLEPDDADADLSYRELGDRSKYPGGKYPNEEDDQSSRSGTVDQYGVFKPATKEYRGMEIDADLNVKHMDRLNAVAGVRVISTDAGHPEFSDPERHGINPDRSVGSPNPSFALRMPSINAATKEKAERLAAALTTDDTRASAKLSVREGWRSLDVEVTSALVNTGDNIKELDAWWDRTLTRLETASRSDMSYRAKLAMHLEAKYPPGAGEATRRAIDEGRSADDGAWFVSTGESQNTLVEKVAPHPSAALAMRPGFEGGATPLNTEGESTRSPAWTDFKPEVEQAIGVYSLAVAHGTPVEMDIDELSTYQTFVSKSRLRELGEKGVDYDKPVGVVFEHAGKKWLVDGNHRTTLAKLSGKKTVKLLKIEPTVNAATAGEEYETSVLPTEITVWLETLTLSTKQPEERLDLSNGEHKGLLISLPVPADMAAQLEVPGGEPASDMHVTLCYVGAAKTMSPEEVQDLREVVQKVIARSEPVTLSVAGTGRFEATEQSDGMDVVYAEVQQTPELLALRNAVYKALKSAGAEPNHDFEYHPHVTLAYVPPGDAAVAAVPPLQGVVSDVHVQQGGAPQAMPLGAQLRAEEQAHDKLKKFAKSSVAGGPVSVRTADVFSKPRYDTSLALNRKTTVNAVEDVTLADVEPRQELIPLQGLELYVTKPRRDPPDVARIEAPDGTVRWSLQEGHTRTAAAILRGEATMPMRTWRFVRNAAGGLEPVSRGLHRRGQAAINLAYDGPIPEGWQLHREGLGKRFEFANRRICAAFVEALSAHANSVNHHPDVWMANNAVTVFYVTHAAGDQVTDLDIASAEEANRLAQSPEIVSLSYRDRLELRTFVAPGQAIRQAIVRNGWTREDVHRAIAVQSPVKIQVSGALMNDPRVAEGVWFVESVNNTDLSFNVKVNDGTKTSFWDAGEITIADDAPVMHVVHEFGHIMEALNPAICAESHALRERLKRANPEAFATAVREQNDDLAKEHTPGSGLITNYSTTQYDDGCTEILSEGFEELYRDPVGFAQKAPEQFDFVVNMLTMPMERPMNMPDSADVSFPTLIGAIDPVKKRKKKKRSVRYRGVTLGRRPTEFEAHVLSLTDIPKRFDAEVDRAVQELAAARTTYLQSWGRVKPFDKRAELKVALFDDTMKALRQAQSRIARYGAFEIRQECQRQGLRLTVHGEAHQCYGVVSSWVDSDRLLVDSLRMAGYVLNRDWLDTFDRAQMRAERSKLPEDRVVALVEPKILWGLKGAARGLLHEAFALSRRKYVSILQKMATPDAAFHLVQVDDDDAEDLVDYVIQTAVMDASTCEPCADADGRTFEYDDDEMQEHQPPYYLCDGGDACRCVQVYVLKDGGFWTVRDGEIL